MTNPADQINPTTLPDSIFDPRDAWAKEKEARIVKEKGDQKAAEQAEAEERAAKAAAKGGKGKKPKAAKESKSEQMKRENTERMERELVKSGMVAKHVPLCWFCFWARNLRYSHKSRKTKSPPPPHLPHHRRAVPRQRRQGRQEQGQHRRSAQGQAQDAIRQASSASPDSVDRYGDWRPTHHFRGQHMRVSVGCASYPRCTLMIVHISAPICDAVQALHLTIPYATLTQVLWALEASKAFSSAMEEVEAKQDAKEDKKVSR